MGLGCRGRSFGRDVEWGVGGRSLGERLRGGGTNPATVLILPEAVGLIASSCPLSRWGGGLGH